MRKSRIILVIGILILIGIMIYTPHLGYDLPIHLDEWIHLSWATYYTDKQSYMEEDELFTKIKLPAHEVGFQLFIAEIFLMSGTDPVLGYKYLASLLTIITSFLLFVFIFKITNNFYAGIFSMLFFAGLRSNTNIMGIWFFVPYVFCFPFVYFLFYSTVKGVEDKRFFTISCLVLLIMYFIHTAIAMLCSFVFIIYLAISYKKLKKEGKLIFIVLLIPLIAVLFYLTVLWEGSFLGLIEKVFTTITFEGYGAGPEIDYQIISFYGVPQFILAVVGIMLCIKKTKERFWIIMVFFLAVLTFIFNLSKISLFANYRRVIYLSLVALVPLSAIGFSATLEYINKKLNKIIKKNALRIIIAVIIILVFVLGFLNYFNLPANVMVFHLIEGSEYKTVKWFESNYGRYNLVFAAKWLSETIYPISKNYATTTKIRGEKQEFEFYNAYCKEKLKEIEKSKIDFIFSKKYLDCSFLKQVYDDNKTIIYEFKDRFALEEYKNITSLDKDYTKIQKLNEFIKEYNNSIYIKNANFDLGILYYDAAAKMLESKNSSAYEYFKLSSESFQNAFKLGLDRSFIKKYYKVSKSQFRLGELNYWKGKNQEAIQEFQKVIDLYPESELANLSVQMINEIKSKG